MSSGQRFWVRWWLELIAVLLLLMPVIVLLVTGVAWLWDRGWLIWWLLGTTTTTVLVWAGVRLRHAPSRPSPRTGPRINAAADPTWAPHEQAAWQSVERFSEEADGATLEDHRLMLAAARRTIDAVAQHYHPGHREPALEFTLPELLLLTERVSARLRLVLLEQVPLSHRLKVRSLIRVWGLRPLLAAGFEHGRRLYWFARVARAASPLHALVAEVRDNLVGDLFNRVQANVRRTVVRLWIEEVGRAAIELYSGRLNVDALELAAAAAREERDGAAAVTAPGCVRLLIAGRPNTGKSTLVRAMLGQLAGTVDVTPLTENLEGYQLRQQGLPLAYVIDSPGTEDDASIAELAERAFACDLIVWVIAADVEDTTRDLAALDSIRQRFAANPRRRMPPLIVVASHLDRLCESHDWTPPYNLTLPSTPTEHRMRAALDKLAASLSVTTDALVPMRLDDRPPYNLELLWLRLEALAEEAHRARWVRLLRRGLEKRDWRRAWRQVVGAGRVMSRLIKR